LNLRVLVHRWGEGGVLATSEEKTLLHIPQHLAKKGGREEVDGVSDKRSANQENPNAHLRGKNWALHSWSLGCQKMRRKGIHPKRYLVGKPHWAPRKRKTPKLGAVSLGGAPKGKGGGWACHATRAARVEKKGWRTVRREYF